MGFLGKRSVAHGPDLESFHNLFYRLHLVQADRLSRRKQVQETPQGMGVVGLVHQGGIFSEFNITSGPDRLLEKDDGLGTVKVVFFALVAAQVMETDTVKDRVHRQTQGVKGPVVAVGDALLQLLDPDAADPAGDAGKILVDDLVGQADGLENPGRLVGLNGGYPHFCRYFYNTVQQGLVIIIDGRVQVLIQQT